MHDYCMHLVIHAYIHKGDTPLFYSYFLYAIERKYIKLFIEIQKLLQVYTSNQATAGINVKFQAIKRMFSSPALAESWRQLVVNMLTRSIVSDFIVLVSPNPTITGLSQVKVARLNSNSCFKPML